GQVLSGPSIAGDTSGDSVHSGLSSMDSDTQFGTQSSQVNQVVSVELTGDIQGDVIAVLDQLEGKFVGSDTMLISCGRLVRVDFSAAGALLNWASARQAEKRSVQFLDVNRLVAAFFNVIGITENATVVVRLD
ncbi:MAG: STAS domain-containing protein, partial [Polaromonas sp.]|nr:STAS domain-containing protein [Polaromonas sp.]